MAVHMDERWQFSIQAAASERFALLSGDYNPLHLDPVAARRTQFGGSVVHGIHLLLSVLEHVAGDERYRNRALTQVAVTFANPVHTGALVDASVQTDVQGDELKSKFSAQSQGRTAFTGSFDLAARNAAAAPVAIPDGEFPRDDAVLESFPPASREGQLESKLSMLHLQALFPNLSRWDEQPWLADLVASTRIVGMRCPGLHSIYSRLKLQRAAAETSAAPRMTYTVDRVDDRFGMIRMAIRGAGSQGTIEAFFRAPPVQQPTLRDLTKSVRPDAFAGQRALIIGGSRGLGELTAKLLAAGAADTTITYASGRDDAARVCGEAEALGLQCRARHLDIRSLDTEIPQWLSSEGFSHVYYFASPPIASNPTGRWNHALFGQFAAAYVRVVATIVEAIVQARSRQQPLHLLYPSSIFVSQPQSGFAEYSAAKAAGEGLCTQLAAQYGIKVFAPRLPKMRTDQTSSVRPSDAADPLPVIAQMLQDFAATSVKP